MLYLSETMASAIFEVPCEENIVTRFLSWARPSPPPPRP
jgi:hypothetical protein